MSLSADLIYEILGFPGVKSRISLPNYQDRLLVYSIFLGVDKDILTELKHSDIDYDNKVITPLNIRVNEAFLDLCRAAKKEKYYTRYNTNEDYQLNESDYLFISTNKDNDKMTYKGVLARLHSMSDYLGVKLTIKDINEARIRRIEELKGMYNL